jgi:hypothetical protein
LREFIPHLMKKKLVLAGFVLSAIAIGTFSCTKEVAPLLGPNDAQLFAMCTDTTNMFYYQNDPSSFLSPAGGSPHGTFKLRFNETAKNALGSDGKLPVGGEFPDSSMVVKVLYTAPQGNIAGYAIMFKLNDSWFRAEYSDVGAVWYGVAGDLSSCLSCHLGSGNRDQILTFNYH